MTPPGRSPFYGNFAGASAPLHKVSGPATAANSRLKLSASAPQAGEFLVPNAMGGPCALRYAQDKVLCSQGIPILVSSDADEPWVQEWQTRPLSGWCWKS